MRFAVIPAYEPESNKNLLESDIVALIATDSGSKPVPDSVR